LLLAVSLNGLNQFYQFLQVTGFIPGRYIGENTRLIYDVLHFTEEQDIPGILLLIDFEKAFDSISWVFIESVLDFFNFVFSIKLWVTTLYTNITSAVTFSFCSCGKTP
jgi:hypothetical protein